MAITWKKLAYSDDPPIAHDLDSTLHTATGNVGNYINISGASLVQYRTPAQVLSDIEAAAASHTHDTGDITDFPSYSGAEAGKTLKVHGSGNSLIWV